MCVYTPAGMCTALIQRGERRVLSAQPEAHQDVGTYQKIKAFQQSYPRPLNRHTHSLTFTHCFDYMIISPFLVLQRAVRQISCHYILFNQRVKGFSISNQARERCLHTLGPDWQVLLLPVSGSLFSKWLKKTQSLALKEIAQPLILIH